MKSAIKKYAVLLTLLALSLLLGACDSYTDLDEFVFVNSILVDKDEESGGMVFYFETLVPVRSSAANANEEKRVTYKIKAQNAGDALNMLETNTSAKITLAQNKVLLFTQKFAQSGIDQCFDLFDRRQRSNTRTLMGIFKGDPKEFLAPEHPEEPMTGLFLYDMLGTQDSFTSIGVRIDYKEFMNQKYIGDRVSSVPIINTSKDEDTQGQYYLDGLGLIKEYKLIGILEREDSFYFNLMLDNVVAGDLTIQNPTDESKMVTLLLLDNSFKSDVEYADGILKVMREFKLDTNLSSVQGKLQLTKENIQKLQDAMAEKIRQKCMALFEEWKGKKTDIFDIQEEFERKYPSCKGINIIESAELLLTVRVKISGSQAIWNTE